MEFFKQLLRSPNRRIAAIGLVIYALDQATKAIVLAKLPGGAEHEVIPGFFKFVHWSNTGAAWSMFNGNNHVLAIVALVALVILYLFRHHFESKTVMGQIAFGFIFGGILGNLTDRLLPSRHHVIDFIRFYLNRPSGEVGFPAFNIADSGICVGVALVFWLTWRSEKAVKKPVEELNELNK